MDLVTALVVMLFICVLLFNSFRPPLVIFMTILLKLSERLVRRMTGTG